MHTDNTGEGAAKIAVGEVERAFGEALGDGEMQARGVVLEVEGRVQKAFGRVADETRAAVAQVTDVYGRASDTVYAVAERIRERPLVALTLAGAAGFLLGHLVGGRGPRVVYVKPRI